MAERLKVAVLIRHYDRSGGGAERYCVELTERLAEIHDVDVYTQKVSTPSENVTFHQIPVKLKRPRFLNQLLFSWFTRRATQGRYDIVHSHDMVTHANIYTLHVPCIKSRWTEASLWQRLPMALGILLSPRKMAYLWLEWRELRPAPKRHFITVSEYLSRNILKSYPDLNGHISVAHPGINPVNIDPEESKQVRKAFRQQHQIPKDAFVLLFVAHGFKRKGLPTLIKALESLDQEDLYLLVAGRGDPHSISFNMPRTEERTHFLGTIRRMESIYPVADALVHPTLGDTYGMVALEALSFQLPLVISGPQYCGISESLSPLDAIQLKNPQNPIELADAIERLHSDHTLKERLSESGYKKALSATWDNTTNNTLHAFQTVTSL